jgi:hypothetical protein
VCCLSSAVQARCDDKKGLLAPGMCEVIELEFCPQGYQYYTDCVRIHSEVDGLKMHRAQ